ncbi:hypothetical protein L3X39_10720 [Sabulilitoribacter multivorans]|uniref:Uncharacterized protein n=1 Tax=Flaviramulus multivorans TaxID=1304750 RepID=A0ABS9IKH6_9FLAO|nr:hypothetical protein [Flaviramulus multivorans]MCF7561109.1 hypothetical protein [Flaviramulus multivorans]
MKTKMKTLLLLPFFALLMLTSCQDEVVDITPPVEEEALTPESELTALMLSASTMDGSADNVIDKASCLSVKLPITVIVNGLEIIIDSKEDFKVIEAIFKEFEDDEDDLEIIFPITVILSNHEEIVIENRAHLAELVAECRGDNEEDDDIECIDFKYPISFTVYNPNFQVIDVVEIQNDRQLHFFIKRVINAEVLASLNFPVTMVLADGTEIEVNNNIQLANVIREAKDACDEDDDNDYGDDDFTKERLDEYLQSCPWVVHEFKRNEDNLNDHYREYVIVFKAENVVKVYARNGDVLTGTWTTRVTDRGALIKLEFDTLVDFTLEWFVYDLDPGRIKLYQAGGNRIILKKNCDLNTDITKERIENYLKECFWRVARLSIDGTDNEKDYIGTPLKFFENNVVKIRVNGVFVEGTYQVLAYNTEGFVLQIQLEGRPNLQLEWFVTFLQPGLIKLESLGNRDNKMVLMRHCPDGDDDINYIDDVLITGEWEVALYEDGDVNKTDSFSMYTIDFLESGWIKVTDPNNGVIDGNWLAYRNEGLHLGMHFGIEEPFNQLNHRWRIVEITPNRVELKDLSSTGAIERILVLEKKN